MAFEKYSTSGILLYAIPLYAAPILAGASSASWASVAVFATLFTAQILKTRPLPDKTWPLIATVLFTLALHGVLASGLFALGRGLSLLTGPLPLPIWFTLAMGAAASALGIWRYRWTPEQAELDAILDETLSAITDLSSPDDDTDQGKR
jgi:hypothetical protein